MTQGRKANLCKVEDVPCLCSPVDLVAAVTMVVVSRHNSPSEFSNMPVFDALESAHAPQSIRLKDVADGHALYTERKFLDAGATWLIHRPERVRTREADGLVIDSQRFIYRA